MGRSRPRCEPHRLTLATLSAFLLAALTWTSAIAGPSTPLRSAIAPQTLASAIERFEELTGISVGWDPDINASALHSEGAAAGLPPQEALTQLLRDTGLAFKVVGERTMKIYVLPPPRAAPPALVQEQPDHLPEVPVQAMRWERQLTRQPVNVRLLDPQTLQDSGIKGLADVGALIPGVDFGFFSSVGSGIYTDLIIRGVTDRHGSTTALFFDDIPLPAARSNTFGRALTPYFDLAGIEILSGAQGPLLGADTQGGAVR